MAEMRDIHEQVLAFLLDWRARRDPGLTFSLAQDKNRLERGLWFHQGLADLQLTFWPDDYTHPTALFTHIDLKLLITGHLTLLSRAWDDPMSESLFSEIAEAIGGTPTSGYSTTYNKPHPTVWQKVYPGTDFLANLQLFLENDKNRIDDIISKYRSAYPDSFQNALQPIPRKQFRKSLQKVSLYRTKPEDRSLTLRSISLENTGLFAGLTLDFGHRATALIGENGCGKTTVLRAAALGMMGTGSPLLNIEDAEIQYLLRIIGMNELAEPQFQNPGRIAVSYSFNGYDFENQQANVVGFRLHSLKGKVVFTDQIDPNGFGLPSDEIDEDEELPYLFVGYPQRYGTKSDGTNFLMRSKAPNAYDVIPLILKTADNRIESLKVWISESWNANGPHKPKVVSLFKLISDILSLPGQPRFDLAVKDAISARKIVVTTPANPDGILYDLLSTGLENLFGWLGHLISRMYDAYPKSENPLLEPAIVLIDEIDNYLHPEVQVRLMKVLLETFPKTQFILTAHSPFILASLPSAEAKAYRIEEGKAVEIEHFYGLSIDKISYDQFGIKKRPVEIQKKIDAMLRAFALGRKTEAEALLDELKPILGEDDPAILDAMLEYQT